MVLVSPHTTEAMQLLGQATRLAKAGEADS